MTEKISRYQSEQEFDEAKKLKSKNWWMFRRPVHCDRQGIRMYIIKDEFQPVDRVKKMAHPEELGGAGREKTVTSQRNNHLKT